MTRAPTAITAGFMPLVDCAILAAAAHAGFAEREGIELRLVRETSWANIRDKVAVGHFDVAHMLAPMPIAANLGLAPLRTPVIAPISLGTGGNTITVSDRLWVSLAEAGAVENGDAAKLAHALARVVASHVAAGSPKLTFAIVHPFSSHHYELAYLAGYAGLLQERDYNLTVLPPTLMVDALAAGQIDGFCAGEPWGSAANARGVGHIATIKSAIWRSSPEKVLGVSEEWASRNDATLHALIRALFAAAEWCDRPQNRVDLVEILASKDILDMPRELVASTLRAAETEAREGIPTPLRCHFRFAAAASTFPWTSHALWFYSQMVRWGQVKFDPDALGVVRSTYRPDIYRAALRPLGVTLPGANAKVEGALHAPTPVGSSTGQLELGPDGFFDGRTFDPDLVAAYIETLRAADHRA